MKELKKMTIITSDNAKTTKGEEKGWFTGIIYLAPHKIAGINVCAHATEGCIDSCLYTAGMGKFSNVQLSRIAKTQAFAQDSKAFVLKISSEIDKLKKKHSRLAIRLNGTSDIPWEGIKIDGKNIFEMHPDIQFYDYTKNWKRMSLEISNYSLTYSRAETDFSKYNASKLIREGKNVAVVVEKDLYYQLLSAEQIVIDGKKINVIDGDQDDLRFLDPKSSLIVLKAKGQAIKDQSGFVVRDIEGI